jgi:hypothetical protein
MINVTYGLLLIMLTSLSCMAMEETEKRENIISAYYKIIRDSRYYIWYQDKQTVNNFNKRFHTNFSNSIPFVKIQVLKATNKKRKQGKKPHTIHKTISNWPITKEGIPLSLLEQESIRIANYHLQKFPSEKKTLEQLEDSFKKNPLGHSTQIYNYLDLLVGQGIIENKGGVYNHGPNGYFAQKEKSILIALEKATQLAQEKHTLAENRINSFIQKNDRYAVLIFLASLLRK